MVWTTTDKLVFFISVPIATVCAGILYYLYFSDDEPWDDLGLVSSKTRLIEIKVANSKVPVIVGRGGSKVKEIQETTNTKINFKDVDGEFKICRIKGSHVDVQKAEVLINDLIQNQPDILTEEIWVPQNACGRIIGRCGETIKSISNQSNATVTVERYTPGIGKSRERQVLIKGTAQEIAVAVSLIKAKVAEDASLRDQIGSRSPRHRAGDRGSQPVSLEETHQLLDQQQPDVEQLVPEDSDNLVKVYVSAVASPDNFWVQYALPKNGAELDQLGDAMTEYYSQPENKELHKLSSVTKGQIVAALMVNDNRWYRVKVFDVLKTANSPDAELDVYFVDYGDSLFVKMSDCVDLRTDFLKLKFQAVECALHNVKPADGKTDWSESVVCELEDLVFSAQWKPVLIKVMDFDKDPTKVTAAGPNGKPIVTVFNPEKGFDAGEELVRRGLAERISIVDRKESDVSSEGLSTMGAGGESTASIGSLTPEQPCISPDDSLSKNLPSSDGHSFIDGEQGKDVSNPIPCDPSRKKAEVFLKEEQQVPFVDPIRHKLQESGHSDATEKTKSDLSDSKSPVGAEGDGNVKVMGMKAQEEINLVAYDRGEGNMQNVSTQDSDNCKSPLYGMHLAESTPLFKGNETPQNDSFFSGMDTTPKASINKFQNTDPSKPKTPSSDAFLNAERSKADPSLPKKTVLSPQEKVMQKVASQNKIEKQKKNSNISNGN